jgi:hypothetical protein
VIRWCFNNGTTIRDGGGAFNLGNSCIPNNSNGFFAKANIAILGGLVTGRSASRDLFNVAVAHPHQAVSIAGSFGIMRDH